MFEWLASLAVGSSRNARCPFTLTSSARLSVVPRKFTLGSVPAFPVRDHASAELGGPCGPTWPCQPLPPVWAWCPFGTGPTGGPLRPLRANRAGRALGTSRAGRALRTSQPLSASRTGRALLSQHSPVRTLDGGDVCVRPLGHPGR